MDSLLSDLREYEGLAASREDGNADITFPASQLPSSRAASRSSLPAPKSEAAALDIASGSSHRPYGSASKERRAHPLSRPGSDVSLSFSTDLHPESNSAGAGASSLPFHSDGFTAQPIAYSAAHSAGKKGAGSSLDAASAPIPMFPGRAPPPAHAPSLPAFERKGAPPPKVSLPASYSGGAAGVSRHGAGAHDAPFWQTPGMALDPGGGAGGAGVPDVSNMLRDVNATRCHVSPGSASLGLTAQCQFDVLTSRYTSVNFGVERIPGSPDFI